MKRLDLHVLLNNTGIINVKQREYMEDIAREINDQIELNLPLNYNDVTQLTYLATRAAKFGTEDNDYRKSLENILELLEENNVEEAINKIKLRLRKL